MAMVGKELSLEVAEAGLPPEARPVLRERLEPALVRALKRGHFLYEPAIVARLNRLGKRLADAEYYTEAAYAARQGNDRDESLAGARGDEIDERMASLLYADLEDYIELTSLFQESVQRLRERHDRVLALSRRAKARDLALEEMDWHTERFTFLVRRLFTCGGRCCRQRGSRVSGPARVEVSQSMRVRERARSMGLLAQILLELADDLSDVVFLVVSLVPLIGTPFQALFAVSVSAFVLVVLVRACWGVALLRKDLLNQSTGYKAAGFLATMFSTSGLQLMLVALKDRETLDQAVIGESAGSTFSDPVATMARAQLLEAQVSHAAFAVMLVKDLPQFLVQLAFLRTLGSGLDAAFFVALGTTVLRLIWHFFESMATALQDAPALRTLAQARHLVFDPRFDDDDNATSDASSRGPESVSSLIRDFVAHNELRDRMQKDPGHALNPLKPGLVSVGAFFSERGSKKRASLQRNMSHLHADVAPRYCSSLFSCKAPPRFLGARHVLHAVRTVELTNCQSVDSDTVRLLAEYCPNLQRLELAFCSKLGDEAFSALAENQVCRLESVGLDGCVKLTEAGIFALAHCTGPGLRRISMRNLPAATNVALAALSEHCHNLEEVHLGWDPVFANEAASSNEGLRMLLTACGPSLRIVKLNFFGADDGRFNPGPLMQSTMSPFLRELSLASNPLVDDAVLDSLSLKFPFLRDLRLTATRVTDKSLRALVSRCHDLQTVFLNETAASVAIMQRVSRHVDSIGYDNKEALLAYYCDVFLEHVRCLMLEMRAASRERVRALGPFLLVRSAEVPRHANRTVPRTMPDGTRTPPSPSTPEGPEDGGETPHMVELRTALDRVRNTKFRAILASSPDLYKACLLSQVIQLADMVRRHRFRLQTDVWGYTLEECRQWNERHREGDTEASRELCGAFKRTIAVGEMGYSRVTSRIQDCLRDASQPPKVFPFSFLRPLGVVATRTLTVQVDPARSEYKLLVPGGGCPQTLVADPGSPPSLRGGISPLYRTTAAGSRVASRFLAIPRKAHYYCFAYPAQGVKHGAFEAELKYEDVTRRFLAYGGFLYFGKERNFLSASAFTVGASLSFNGPFLLGEAASRSVAERWHPVTIDELVPAKFKDANGTAHHVCRLEFTWLFPDEALNSPALDRHATHGAFAYRVTTCTNHDACTRACAGTGVRVRDSAAIFFSLASISDVFPTEELS